jgi:tetratricopeptide (TPR) repeat protein
MKRFRIAKIMLFGVVLLAATAGGARAAKAGQLASRATMPTLPAPRAAVRQADHRQTGQSARTQAITKRAQKFFWKAFRSEDYARIGRVIQLLTAAYLSDPKNPETTLLLAHAYLWRVAERGRGHAPRTQALPTLILAQRFFEEAYRLSPGDGRIIGWLGSVRLPLARILRDKRLTEQAEVTLHTAVKRYPRFNDFTSAYSFANWPAGSKQYSRALRKMAATLAICPNQSVGEKGGKGFGDEIKMAPKVKAACGNTAQAPYNIEGFLMSYGDMLVKAEKYATAVAIYKKAEVSPGYATWPYKGTLQSRLKRVYGILDNPGKDGAPARNFPMIAGSKYTCAACHAKH